MKQRPRIYYTDSQKALMWERWRKGDVSNYTQAQLNAIARKLNERPRKTLDYATPAERFHQTVALTG
jgi:IS30 family transposase